MTPEIDVVVDVPSTKTGRRSGIGDDFSVPPIETIVSWAEAACEVEPGGAHEDASGDRSTSLCIRIVERHEMQSLNHEFADKPYATNVLSFPMIESEFTFPEVPVSLDGASVDCASVDGASVDGASVDCAPMYDFPERTLGDIAICAQIVNAEAREQLKTKNAHWAHMVVHGVLHLRGFDHQEEAQANIMEQKEKDILAVLGFADPYHAMADVTLRSGNPSYGG